MGKNKVAHANSPTWSSGPSKVIPQTPFTHYQLHYAHDIVSTDYDPEADVVPDESDQSSDESSDNEVAGTEHYEPVGYAIYLCLCTSALYVNCSCLPERVSSVATSPWP